MNWRFTAFLLALGSITFAGGYQYQLLNYHQNDISTWALRIAVVVLCLFGIVVSLINTWSRRQGLSVMTALIAILISWVAAMFAGHYVNKIRSKETRANADIIVKAVQRFYAKEHRYPDRLSDIQPKYLKHIPATTLGADNAFEYYSSKHHFAITYQDIRSTAMRFDSEKGNWEILDRSFE